MTGKRSSHARSPVQSGTDRPWLLIVAPALAALAFWTYQQSAIDESAGPADEPATIAAPPAQVEPDRAQAVAPPVRARANLASYFSSDDYPSSAIRREETGTVGFRLEVDQRGRVRRCDVTAGSGSPALDRATCSILLERARYIPARNSQGRAVPDTATGRIRWELPEE